MSFLNFLEKTVSEKVAMNNPIMVRFWNGFYQLNFQSLTKSKKESSSSKQYKDTVVKLLEEFKATHSKPYSDEALKVLQLRIENLTLNFHEESMQATCSHVMKELISKNTLCAKDFILNRKDLNPSDRVIIERMNQYTLECIVVHAIGLLYDSGGAKNLHRLSTVVDTLDREVRTHYAILQSLDEERKASLEKSKADSFSLISKEESVSKTGESQKPKSERKKRVRGDSILIGKHFHIGVVLMEFVLERGLMYIHQDGEKDRISKASEGDKIPLLKKGGKYYYPRFLYAAYSKKAAELPIKMSLPMVCRPEKWDSALGKGQNPTTVMDLKGGYLSCLGRLRLLSRNRLLTSSNVNNLTINIEKDYETICWTMNHLQCEAYRISKEMLSFIDHNLKELVNEGLLMPPVICSVEMKELAESLRTYYRSDAGDEVKKLYTYSGLLTILQKDVQTARFESLLLSVCRALEGFDLYIPVSLDFRGRIYRSGLLHFHERDLVRSLLVFKGRGEAISERGLSILKKTNAYHFKSFDSYDKAQSWYEKESPVWGQGIRNLIQYAVQAKKPFQFVSSAISLLSRDGIQQNRMPITQDASASAFQILSYLLLDRVVAGLTNLIPYDMEIKGANQTNIDIYDIYGDMRKKLVKYILLDPDPKLTKNLKDMVVSSFDRPLVKSIFMPMVYGKTLQSLAHDLKSSLGPSGTTEDGFVLAKTCFKFWSDEYRGMSCLINLIKSIGWLVSARDGYVIFDNKIYTCVQRYTKFDSVNVWLYEPEIDVKTKRRQRKRRQITLQLSTNDSDRRKSEVSTFVNFIHQLDAYIAMNVVIEMGHKELPIYTVHDNFISTPDNCEPLPWLYNQILGMEDPLSIINHYIWINLISNVGKIEELSSLEEHIYEIYHRNAGETDHPILYEMLRKYLWMNVPVGLKKKELKVWEGKISTIVESYANYTKTLSGSMDVGNNIEQYHKYLFAYRRNLHEFRGRMNLGEYSLHY